MTIPKTVERADIATAQTATKAKDHPVTRVIGAAAKLADQPPLIMISVATIGFGLLTRNPVRTGMGVRMLASHLLATAAKSAIKRNVDRERPGEAGDHRLKPGTRDEGAVNSFPSGHTAGAVAVARAVAHSDPRAAPLANTAAALAGAVQVPRAKHFPVDVIAGAIIGWAAEKAVGAVVRPSTRPPGKARRSSIARAPGVSKQP